MSAHAHIRAAEYDALASKVESLQLDEPTAGSTEGRFRELLEHGLGALDTDSYGIAATYVIRGDGLEISFTARNTVAQGDPRGHAEMNAIGTAVDVLTQNSNERSEGLASLIRAGRVSVRPCPHGASETILYSTLEPCPMCTVVAINAGVNTVIFAHEDPEAGALAPPRLEGLAPLWARTVEQMSMRVVRCQSDDPADAESYLPPDVSTVLEQLFQITRARLDKQLSSSSFFSPHALTKVLGASRADWKRLLDNQAWSTRRSANRPAARSKRAANRKAS